MPDGLPPLEPRRQAIIYSTPYVPQTVWQPFRCPLRPREGGASITTAPEYSICRPARKHCLASTWHISTPSPIQLSALRCRRSTQHAAGPYQCLMSGRTCAAAPGSLGQTTCSQSPAPTRLHAQFASQLTLHDVKLSPNLVYPTESSDLVMLATVSFGLPAESRQGIRGMTPARNPKQ